MSPKAPGVRVYVVGDHPDKHRKGTIVDVPGKFNHEPDDPHIVKDCGVLLDEVDVVVLFSWKELCEAQTKAELLLEP